MSCNDKIIILNKNTVIIKDFPIIYTATNINYKIVFIDASVRNKYTYTKKNSHDYTFYFHVDIGVMFINMIDKKNWKIKHQNRICTI